MLSKNQIKLIRSLALKKYRKKHQLFIAEGRKVLEELKNCPEWIDHIFLIEPDDSWKGLPIDEINQIELEKISQHSQPHFGLAVLKIPAIEKRESPFHLVLDGISDPGNLGTMIRIADWYGIEQIFAHNCVDEFNPKTIAATMGSFLRVQVLPFSEASIHKPLYGATLSGDNIQKTEFQLPCSLVIGSEAHGISSEIFELLDKQVGIERRGKAESLNAAVACGIFMEHISQRY